MDFLHDLVCVCASMLDKFFENGVVVFGFILVMAVAIIMIGRLR